MHALALFTIGSLVLRGLDWPIDLAALSSVSAESWADFGMTADKLLQKYVAAYFWIRKLALYIVSQDVAWWLGSIYAQLRFPGRFVASAVVAACALTLLKQTRSTWNRT